MSPDTLSTHPPTLHPLDLAVAALVDDGRQARAEAERRAAERQQLLAAERSAQISDPRELMRAAIDLWLSFVEAEPEVYRFLTNGSFLNHDGAAGHRLVAELGAALARVLGGFLRERRVDSGGAEAWAFGIVGMVHLACEWWLDRRTMSRLDLVDYLSELLWGGLAGNGLAAPPSELLSPDESRSTDPHR